MKSEQFLADFERERRQKASMMLKEQPNWMLDDEELNEPHEPLKVSRIAATSETDQTPTKFKSIIAYSSKIIAILLSLLMAATALYGLCTVNQVDQTERIFVAVYMMFFSALLLAFEVNQIRHVPYLDDMFKRNFGFMYNHTGNALFIIL